MSGNLLPSATYASPGVPLYASASGLVSPVSVISPDGTKVGVIAQNNNGNMVIYGDPSGRLFLGNGVTHFVSSNPITGPNNFINSLDSDLRLTGTASGTLTSYNNGLNIVAADKAYVRQGNGANGQIYDTIYNPVASVNASTYTSPAVPVNANTLIGSGTLSAGLYMLQAKVNIDTSSGSYTAGTSINCYVEDLPAVPPTTYAPFSAITITPGMLSAPISPDVTIDCTFSSAVFSVPSGKTNWKYVVEVAGSWSFGNGNLTLQMVKLG